MRRKQFLLAGVFVLMILVAIMMLSAIPALATNVWSSTYTQDFTEAHTGLQIGEGPTSIHLVADNSVLMRSTNNGTSFSATSLTQLVTALKNHADQTSNIWAGTSDGVYKSTDTGATWSDINNSDLPDGDTLWDIEIIDITGGHLILATNTTDGALDCSDDGGSTWVDLLDTTNPRGLSVFDGYLYVASDDGLNRISTPSDCTVPTWDTAASGAWSQAYDIAAYNGDYYVATDGGVYIGDWTTNWVQEWDVGRVLSFFAFNSPSDPFILAGTETQGVIRRNESTSVWGEDGSGLELEKVNIIAGPMGTLRAYGATNTTTSYAVWRAQETADYVSIYEFYGVQDDQDVTIYWSTCTELNNVGYDIYRENQYYKAAYTMTYPEWTKLNTSLIPSCLNPMGCNYSLTWSFDPNTGIGLCSGSNRILEKDLDYMSGWTSREYVIEGVFQNITGAKVSDIYHNTVTMEVQTGDEIHVGGIEPAFTAGLCKDVTDESTWYSGTAVDTNNPGTWSGDTYYVSVDLPSSGDWCVTVLAKETYPNCTGPYNDNGARYPEYSDVYIEP